jgi:putative phosphonate metabolism protein
MSTRYAVYYTPPAGDPLTRRASAWLGRDAFTGAHVRRPGLSGLEGLDLDALTEDPRFYGVHATLKAPFELAEGTNEEALLDFAEGFAKRQAPFEAAIVPAALGRFLAFRLAKPSPEMQALHGACVREFDPFRAPLGEADLARRRNAPLTAEQEARLLAWGYPYVFDDFRFHMSLTGPIADPATAGRLLAALQAHFADLSGSHHFGGVAVFRQDDRSQPFGVLARFDFLAQPSDAAVAGD